MILSYNVIQKDQDSSTDSIKEEGINEIKNTELSPSMTNKISF